MTLNVEQLANDSGMTQYVAANNKFLERFAQLVVAECAQVCLETAEKQFSPLFQRESDGAMVCYKKLSEIT